MFQAILIKRIFRNLRKVFIRIFIIKNVNQVLNWDGRLENVAYEGQYVTFKEKQSD